jgi:hypothetical protein
MGIVRQDQLIRANINRLPQINEKSPTSTSNIRETVKRYVEQAVNNASLYCLPVSKYVSFLKNNLGRFKVVDILLKETERWLDTGQKVTAENPVDLWRVKYTISKAVSEHDKSNSPSNKKKKSSFATLNSSDTNHPRNRPFKTEVDLGLTDSRRMSYI